MTELAAVFSFVVVVTFVGTSGVVALLACPDDGSDALCAWASYCSAGCTVTDSTSADPAWLVAEAVEVSDVAEDAVWLFVYFSSMIPSTRWASA